MNEKISTKKVSSANDDVQKEAQPLPQLTSLNTLTEVVAVLNGLALEAKVQRDDEKHFDRLAYNSGSKSDTSLFERYRKICNNRAKECDKLYERINAMQ